MVKKAPKYYKKHIPPENPKADVFFRTLFSIINFFVYIGEGTRVLLTLPIKSHAAIKKSLIVSGKSIHRNVNQRKNDTINYFLQIKKNIFTKKPKLKEQKAQQTAIVSSPVKSEKRKSKTLSSFKFKMPSYHFNMPSISIPKLRFPNIKLPSLRFPTFTMPKITIPQIAIPKRSQPVSKFKKTTAKTQTNTEPYTLKVSRSIFRYIGLGMKALLVSLFFLITILWKIIKDFVGVIFFLIRKPFEFLNTLFTAQLRFFILGIVLCAVFFIGREIHQFVVSLPSPREIGKVNYSLATHLNDRNGKLLYEIYRDEKRTPIATSKLPKYITQASVAIEDKDFYNHKGVSLISGILRAFRETVFKGSLQGGSTITQQLVKSALLSPERTITRKAKEIILALWAEQIYSKEEILQMYMNQVPYGGAAYGIQEASRTYFGKDAQELSIAEASLLAGLPQAPSIYSPFVNPNLAIERRNDVLANMREQKFITESQYRAAISTPLQIIKPEISIKAPHFVFYVKTELEKQFGTRMVEQGGLKVTTTLDLEVQQEVEKILREELERQRYLNVSNGAIMVTKPSTGEIIAMVGSVDYFEQPYGAFNVTNAERQPGSSLKPLLFSLALQKGYTAASPISDNATTFVIPGAEPYRPVNYDGRYHGVVPMRQALANSYNVTAVKALYDVGIGDFVSYMSKLGISTWNDPGRYVLPMALGGVEVKMVDLATAYGALANEGYRTDLTGLEKLTNSREEVMFELKPQKTRVMQEGVSYIISDILSDNVARQSAFGPGSQLEIPGYKVAVKTGTTDSKRDNWAIGYTPEYLVSVWIGNNDNTVMNPAIESGATGASSLWNKVMTYMIKNKSKQPDVWFSKPENIVERSCYGGRLEYFLAGTENSVSCAYPTPTQPGRNNQQRRLPPGQQRQIQYNNQQINYNP